MSAKTDEILESLKSLSLLEASELVKQIVSSDLAQHLLDDIGKILRAKLANK